MTTISLTVTPTDMLLLKYLSDEGLDSTGLIAHIIELVGDDDPIPEDVQHDFLRDIELISLIKADRPPRYFLSTTTPRHWVEDDHE